MILMDVTSDVTGSNLTFLNSSKAHQCWNFIRIYGDYRNRVGIGLSYLPARLHRWAGRYDNSVPTRFLFPVDCSKIPALV